MYEIADDPAELNDLSANYPERLEKMIGMWEQYKDDNAVLDAALDLSRGFE